MAVDNQNIRNDNEAAYEIGKACRNILISEIRKYDTDFEPRKWAENNISYLVGEVLKHDPEFTKDHLMFLQAVGMSALNYCSIENFEKSNGLYKVSYYAKDVLKQGFSPLIDVYSRTIDKAADLLNEKAESIRENLADAEWAANYVFSKEFVDDIKKDANIAKKEFSDNISKLWTGFTEEAGFVMEDIRKGLDGFGKETKPYLQRFAKAVSLKDKLQVINDVSAVDNEASLEMIKHLRDQIAEEKNFDKAFQHKSRETDNSYEPTLSGILKKGIDEIKLSVENYRNAADRLSFEANKITLRFVKEIGAAIKDTAKDVYDLTKQKTRMQQKTSKGLEMT